MVEEMAVAHDLDPVETRRLHPLGRVDIVLDDPGDVPILGRFRGRTVGGFAFVGRGHDRQPVALVPAGRRPRWLSWIITAAPASWQSSASRFIQGTISSFQTRRFENTGGLSRLVLAEPGRHHHRHPSLGAFRW